MEEGNKKGKKSRRRKEEGKKKKKKKTRKTTMMMMTMMMMKKQAMISMHSNSKHIVAFLMVFDFDCRKTWGKEINDPKTHIAYLVLMQ